MKRSRSVIIAALLCCCFGTLLAQQADSLELRQTAIPVMAAGEVMADSATEELNIPNVFSPNQDDKNDYFEVLTDGTTVYKFSVFTRAGSRVYFTESPTIWWDGNSLNGRPLQTGTYYYVIQDSQRQSKYSGLIYLYR